MNREGLWAGLSCSTTTPPTALRGGAGLPCTPLAGEVALGLAVLATAWAIFWLRSRPGLMIGAAALTALLIVVAYIGGVSPTTTKIP